MRCLNVGLFELVLRAQHVDVSAPLQWLVLNLGPEWTPRSDDVLCRSNTLPSSFQDFLTTPTLAPVAVNSRKQRQTRNVSATTTQQL
jgi:hypothetical protein